MKIYSIKLSEKEIRLFSDFIQKKEYSSKKKKKEKDDSEDSDSSEKREDKDAQAMRRIAAGVSIASLSKKVPTLARNKFMDKYSSYNISEEDKKIKSALLKKASDQGIEVIKMPEYGNSAYMGSPLGKKLKDKFDLDDFGGIYDHLGKDAIIVGGSDGSLLNSSGVLSHELGHAQYMSPDGVPKRSKDFIARGAHKLLPISTLASSNLGIAASAVHGYHSGLKSEKDKEEGKKESKWNKVRSVAVPSILVAPSLIAEGSASVKGLKLMKEAGASKELINDAKGDLASAFGTYAASALLPVAAGYAGRLVGKGVARLKKKKKKKDSKDTESKRNN